MGCFDCCGSENRSILYIVGSKAHKDLFLANVLSVSANDKTFHEYHVSARSQPFIIQSCEVGRGLKEIDEMHSKISGGVVYLTDVDAPVNCESPTLFVLVGQKSRQVSQGNVIVASIVNDTYKEVKNSFEQLLGMIKQ